MPDGNDTVTFIDNTATIIGALTDAVKQFLVQAGGEMVTELVRLTPSTEVQLRGSWKSDNHENDGYVDFGSELEMALWNEYGTGSHAEDTSISRPGWWVYIEGQPKMEGYVSNTYATFEEAQAAADYLRRKGLDARASNGKPPNRTFRTACSNKETQLMQQLQRVMKTTFAD